MTAAAIVLGSFWTVAPPQCFCSTGWWSFTEGYPYRGGFVVGSRSPIRIATHSLVVWQGGKSQQKWSGLFQFPVSSLAVCFLARRLVWRGGCMLYSRLISLWVMFSWLFLGMFLFSIFLKLTGKNTVSLQGSVLTLNKKYLASTGLET